MRRANERGDGKIGCLIGLVVVAVAVVIGVKTIPKKIAVAEFRDYIERQAEAASLPKHTDEEIHKLISEKAQELQLPVRREDIKVWRTEGEIHVEVKYTVVLDFPAYTYYWPIEHKVDRPLF